MKRKQIASLILLITVLFTMVVGCGGSSPASSTPTTQPPQVVQQTKPSEQPSTAPTDTVKPVTPPVQPTPKPVVAPPVQRNTQTQTVYTTKTGSKYHSAGCQYLSKSCIPISLSDAKASGLTPCSKCSPPR